MGLVSFGLGGGFGSAGSSPPFRRVLKYLIFSDICGYFGFVYTVYFPLKYNPKNRTRPCPRNCPEFAGLSTQSFSGGFGPQNTLKTELNTDRLFLGQLRLFLTVHWQLRVFVDFTGLTFFESVKHRISVWKLAYLLGVFNCFSKLIKSVFQKLLSEISSFKHC